MSDAKRKRLHPECTDSDAADIATSSASEAGPRVTGMGTVRWAFRMGSWRPTQEQWLLAASCIQKEEKTRIGKFVFKKDGKSSISGRLLMRKVICQCLGMPY